jgi:UDP-N-acetylmuramyl pentapeptide phosphotransferase/UDP-N-acetylglucosamine-1-phosphate transferase
MLIIYYISMLVVNFYLIIFFIKIAKKRQIVAIGNNKNLHEGIIPRGAGIVFGFIYLFSIAMAFRENYITSDIFFPIILGSFLCLLLGFVDDVYDLKILVKFSFQFLIIFLLVFYFFNPSLFENNFILNFISIILITFLAIWTLNAYNFIDGADGHLGSVAFMQGFLLMISLNMHKNFDLMIPIFLLCSVLLVFLKFNWSPAKVFMGDAGSLFIGINFIIYILLSMKFSFMSFFSILIIFSYYLIDTLGTFVIRLYLKKTWRVRHRSHPYQNFSRIYNHSTMSKCAIIYHLVWLLPLLILSNIFTNYEVILSLIAIIPAIVFLVKFGPTYSSE